MNRKELTITVGGDNDVKTSVGVYIANILRSKGFQVDLQEETESILTTDPVSAHATAARLVGELGPTTSVELKVVSPKQSKSRIDFI
jgi:hypothetical protein